MSMSMRVRSIFSFFQKILRSDSLFLEQSLLCPPFANSEFSRNFATASPPKEKKIKVPVTMFGLSGNYASALYIASVKANTLDNVESDLLDLISASKKSNIFSLFMKDISVAKDTRVKALSDICAQAKFSEITRNFLVVMAENGRLKYLETITKRFSDLTMAHRGELKAIVTTVIPLPAEEEKELKETLQEIIGHGKKVRLEQKIDPSILGGIMVEFGQKVFDMSIRTRAKQMERFLREPLSLGL